MGARATGLIARRAALLAGAAACALSGACGREPRGLEPQHFLLVTVENLRADRCSFLMHDRTTTRVPSDELMRVQQRAFGLDAIASDGVVFARCFAPSPVRDVSLASLFSSRPPLESGVTHPGDALPGEVVTLAEALGAGGFETAAFLGGATQPDASFAAGFATVERCASDLAALRCAATWLGRDPGSGARTFVWIHLSELAPPWQRHERGVETADLLELRGYGDPDYEGPIDGSPATLQRIASGELAPDAADKRALRALYDRQVARLATEIWSGFRGCYDFHSAEAEAAETWPRTAFVLAGLNGLELLEHGAVGTTGLLSDATLHVPLVLRHRDTVTGERILDDVVELADVAPTVLEWADLPPLPAARGRSLLALVERGVERDDEGASRRVFAQLPDRGVFSVRDERWRLVWNPLRVPPAGRPTQCPPLSEVALYDARFDPAGLDDRAAEEPEAVADLLAAIRAWREPQQLFPVEKKPARRVPATAVAASPLEARPGAPAPVAGK